jgi:ABC-type Fe3+-hydroxamate transport system substrate-binding protein
MLKVIDGLSKEIELQTLPLRIVSTVPSQTELLYSLGLTNQILGYTWFCIHPKEKPEFAKKIGGTKNLKIDIIESLKPDLIIANKEENEKEQIEQLSEKFQTYVSDIFNLNDALKMILDVGILTDTEEKAQTLINNIKTKFSSLEKINNQPKVLYMIWKKPWMCAGKDTFIDSMLSTLGFINAVPHSRYPILEETELEGLKPDFIFLSSEPYPFKEKHINELQNRFPNSKVLIVDGEMFSWYGSRLIESATYFKDLLNKIASE